MKVACYIVQEEVTCDYVSRMGLHQGKCVPMLVTLPFTAEPSDALLTL